MRCRSTLVAVALVIGACSDTTSDAPAGPAETNPTASIVVESTSTSTTTTTTTATSSSTTTSTTTLPTTDSPSANVEHSAWTGTIDGDISISMWLAEQDGHIRGELVYDRVGEPITLLGRRHDDGFVVVHEFASDGRVTGTLSFVDDGERAAPIEGRWGDLDLVLDHVGRPESEFRFDPEFVPGVYSFQFAPFGEAVEGFDEPAWGASGWLRIHTIGPRILIEIQNTRGAPGYNLAVIDQTDVLLVGHNTLVFDSDHAWSDHDAVDCAFEITAYAGFAFIDHVDERWDCGFGMGAGVEGAYLLTAPAER